MGMSCFWCLGEAILRRTYINEQEYILTMSLINYLRVIWVFVKIGDFTIYWIMLNKPLI